MNISALDEDGKPVDWWFAYKLPTLPNLKYDPNNSVGEAQGTEYLYCDASSPALPSALSPHAKILESGALVNTIQQLHEAAELSFIMFCHQALCAVSLIQATRRIQN
jgi:deoxyribonuclease-2